MVEVVLEDVHKFRVFLFLEGLLKDGARFILSKVCLES